ncbi:hypothetical protein [uncultured Erythrobacter sp.]|uniref:hypothetical protein n=1 Tax=uncultured Erythrobacter sp. TaxID=263913 RepID=UPI002614E192|nr:hypothetical protein [uncultured Erythrobacter sp.]
MTSLEIAAKREAFIASERARIAHQGLAPAQPQQSDQISSIDGTPYEDPMINLRNMRPTERPARRMEPAQPMGGGPIGASGLSAAQEAEIRAAARGMARGEAPRMPGGSGGARGKSGKTFFFGDPAGRSLGMAYLIWFVIGQTSLHRVYCGHGESAIYQVGLLIGSIIAAFIFLPFAFGIVIWMIWLFADLFLMPGMMRRFKAKYDYDTGVFD